MIPRFTKTFKSMLLQQCHHQSYNSKNIVFYWVMNKKIFMYTYFQTVKLSSMFCETHYSETNTGRENPISLYSEKPCLKKLPSTHKQQIQYTLKRQK